MGHPHDAVHVLLAQAPRATKSSCHRLSASEGSIPSRLVITGGAFCMSLLCCGVSEMTGSASACSRCTVLVARPSVIDFWNRFDMGCGRTCCLIWSKFWKSSERIFTRLRSLIDFNPRTSESSAIRTGKAEEYSRKSFLNDTTISSTCVDSIH